MSMLLGWVLAIRENPWQDCLKLRIRSGASIDRLAISTRQQLCAQAASGAPEPANAAARRSSRIRPAERVNAAPPCGPTATYCAVPQARFLLHDLG